MNASRKLNLPNTLFILSITAAILLLGIITLLETRETLGLFSNDAPRNSISAGFNSQIQSILGNALALLVGVWLSYGLHSLLSVRLDGDDEVLSTIEEARRIKRNARQQSLQLLERISAEN
jgi:hypothetical protein